MAVLGRGDGTFAPRTRVGGGWNAYRQLVGIGDADHDGHADLIAEEGWDGVSHLSVYKGNGNWKAPFGPGEYLDRPSPYSDLGAPHPLLL
ncbi:FG-GAP repeat domain-containing protein [Streptomyces sp. NPDC093105]|uniref:FG-GAP repeat domain-containing protein n=1 Tax=Streptomyces sp. NPDC093105 TaxID=3366029 RepID=UPI0038228F92